jgi:uncharacterized protein (TIGR02246 family)
MSFKFSITTLLLCAVVFLNACGGTTTTAPQQTVTAAPDPAPINDLRSRFEAAYNAGDAAGVTALYTDDAVSMPDHHAAVQGKAALQQYFQEVFAQYTTKLSLLSPDLEINGDVAHETGIYTMIMTPKAGGNAMTQSGKYLVVLKRQPDGLWRLHHDIDNTSTPMAMPARGRR